MTASKSPIMRLYHTGFFKLPHPDVHYGRPNADFGQGFYLTADQDFALRWSRENPEKDTFVNEYDLNTEGLCILSLERDQQWFDYLYANRNFLPDQYAEFDVIVGPIANDTIYDTFGIITSGMLSKENSLKLLQVGPQYRQIALKTERAVKQLTWLSARELSHEEMQGYHETVRVEEAAFQEIFAKELERLTRED